MTSYWFAEYGASEGPEWFQTDCIMSPSDSPDHAGSILHHSFFIGPLFHKPVTIITGQELFFAVSYSKPALAPVVYFVEPVKTGRLERATCKVVHLVSDWDQPGRKQMR